MKRFNLAASLKAEVILAIQLVTRHQAPRPVLLLVACLALITLRGGPAVTPAAVQRTLLLAAGLLGAVAGSRLLARGGALGAARQAGTWSAVPVVGRTAGALILIGPVLLLICFGLAPESRVMPVLLVALLFGAVQVTLAMALAPAIGASAAAAIGFFVAFLDGVGLGDAWELSAWLIGGLWVAALVIERLPESGGGGEP